MCLTIPQISAFVSLHGEVRVSVPSSVVQRFQSIPSPQNTEVIITNPRILQFQSTGMLQISFELFASWTWLYFEVSVRNFEIYIGYSEHEFLCVYDSFPQLSRIKVGTCMYVKIVILCVPYIA